jgi:hypothetical protein
MIERVRLRQSSAYEPSPVLITESAEEFERLHDSLIEELKPRGALERYLVADMAGKMWEIRRLHRVKPSLINSAFRRAIKDLFDWLYQPEQIGGFETKRHELAGQWFTDERIKKQISQVLAQFNLDEHAIEAHAVRKVSRGLEDIDGLMASLEWRLHKTIRTLAELQLGRQLQRKDERIINGKVLALGDVSKKSPPAGA